MVNSIGEARSPTTRSRRVGSTLTRAGLGVLLTTAVVSLPAAAAPSVGGLAAVSSVNPADAASPQSALTDDPLGSLVDVTASWQHYQPAPSFCVRPNVFEFPADTEATRTGSDPACGFSGFGRGDNGLYQVGIASPPLCSGCRRLFIDYSKIAAGALPALTAHG
ncbi:MAG: hypothetical protein ACRDWB_08010, partial [Acidimicrobiales bacterium]